MAKNRGETGHSSGKAEGGSSGGRIRADRGVDNKAEGARADRIARDSFGAGSRGATTNPPPGKNR